MGSTILVSFPNSSGQMDKQIPDWIKSVAGWWANDEISEKEFLEGLTYLINNNIIFIHFMPCGGAAAVAASNPALAAKLIPDWVKNNAGWWATDQIDDSSFLQGIQYLIKEGIMVIPPTETSGSSESQGVPAWVKNNAGWWADGQIDDNSFISGIQYLIKSGIIVVEQEQAQSTQPTVTDKEIQKLADEYWDCFTGDRVTSGCVAWDEDKHAIGGIDGLTFISGYQVFDGCPGCDWKNDYHDPVDAKLEKFQDEDLHKQLFDMYVSITPEQILDEVVYFEITTDGYGGKEAAAVGRSGDDFTMKYWLSIDPLDMAPSAGSIDKKFHKTTMIHENAHILSLGSSQSDNDDPYSSTGIDDLYEEPYTELRKIVEEKNIDTKNISGSGKEGRILKGDLINLMGSTPKPSDRKTQYGQEERIRMTRLRMTIAKRLKQAQETAAILTTFNEVDMRSIIQMRKDHQEDFKNRFGIKLGFMSFFVKACIVGLKNFPAINAEIDNEEIVYKNYYNISFAVGTDKGLVVPVLKNADELSFADIEKNIKAISL